MNEKSPAPAPADVRAARESKNLTQAAAAAAVGVSWRAWAHWEAGTRPMSAPAWMLFQKIRSKR